uniref:Uncharacterized protein n=1 Tax=Glossina palpalis gambiensis TaxID=67801 RepID=A0A1B0B3G6_9MUSC
MPKLGIEFRYMDVHRHARALHKYVINTNDKLFRVELHFSTAASDRANDEIIYFSMNCISSLDRFKQRIFPETDLATVFNSIQRGEALYRFIPEDVDLFRDCQGHKNFRGSESIDLRHFSLSYSDEGIHAKGTVEILWDVEEHDRISMHCELKKYFRGTWQSTMFSVLSSDFCKDMKDTTSFVYDVWTKHIMSEEIHCPAKGRKYDHETFSLNIDFNVSGIHMEGRHKIVLIFRAYDQMNREKPNAACIEVPGDIIKV